MRNWSDESFDWNGLNEAGNYIGDFCLRWARLGGQVKEKLGGLRFYANFGLSLHGLVYPGYMYSQFPQWLWVADINYITPILQFLFGRVWGKWQCFIYRLAYKNAVKKWPHLREEILGPADQDHLLKDL